MRADEGDMLEVRARDEARIARICDFDARGFFELVHPGADGLNWCGYSPLSIRSSALSSQCLR